MHINLESDYAVRIVHCLSRAEGRLDAQTISQRTAVSPRFTLKIMRKLVGEGIARSYKGAHGGYTLARSPQEITLRPGDRGGRGALSIQPLSGWDIRL